jgi:hypothetical protein
VVGLSSLLKKRNYKPFSLAGIYDYWTGGEETAEIRVPGRFGRKYTLSSF